MFTKPVCNKVVYKFSSPPVRTIFGSILTGSLLPIFPKAQSSSPLIQLRRTYVAFEGNIRGSFTSMANKNGCMKPEMRSLMDPCSENLRTCNLQSPSPGTRTRTRDFASTSGRSEYQDYKQAFHERKVNGLLMAKCFTLLF